MDAVLYIRFSTSDQSKGDSIKRQKELGAAMEKQHGLTIVETLIDHGKSAYHGHNRATGGRLYEIEERAKRGELAGKALIFEAMDRMSRQEPLESMDLIRDFTKSGMTLCESSTGRIYDSAKIKADWTSLILILAKAAEAYASSDNKSRLVRSAWRKTQTGAGMKDDGGADPRLCPDWMTVTDGKYEPIEERAAMIRAMFEMSAKGYGLRAISNALKDEQKRVGWPTGELDIRRIGNLLRGRRVLGEYQPQSRGPGNTREDVGGPIELYPAIVSLEQWHEVQRGLENRRGTGGRERRRAINVLSHLCRCQYHNEGENVPCGSRMTYKGLKHQQPQLTCTRFARAAGCKSNATFRYQSILDGILDELGSLPLPDQVPGEQPANLGLEWAELKKKKARLDQLADQLIMEDDPVKEAAYQRFRKLVAEEERELNERSQGQERQSVTLSPAEMAKRAQELRSELQDSVEARLQLQTYLDNLIDVIFMEPKDRTATVVMFEGLVNFKLDRAGNVIARANALPVLDDTFRSRLVGDQPERASQLDRVVQYARSAG